MERVELHKQLVSHNTGKASLAFEDAQKLYFKDMEAAVRELDSLRAGGKNKSAVDISLAQYAQKRWGISAGDSDINSAGPLFEALGLDPSADTIESLYSMPEFEGRRWLVPEIFREAVRLGLRRSAIYNNLIVADQSVSQTSITMPYVNMSDATPGKLGEAESIPQGSLSFNEKTVKIDKYGIGLEVSDEVLRYVPLNVVNVFLQDMGVKLGRALDEKAIDTLINGDQTDGSESAPVIGVETTGNYDYTDILRSWIRMGRLGRGPAGMLSGENVALEVLELPEFKALAGTGTLQNIQLSTPVPNSQNYWIHGAMPANQLMMVDNNAALIKLTSQAVRVESERIVKEQLNGSYATLTTGFANMFRDARLIIDKSVAFSGYPSYMDVDAVEQEGFKND